MEQCSGSAAKQGRPILERGRPTDPWSGASLSKERNKQENTSRTQAGSGSPWPSHQLLFGARSSLSACRALLCCRGCGEPRRCTAGLIQRQRVERLPASAPLLSRGAWATVWSLSRSMSLRARSLSLSAALQVQELLDDAQHIQRLPLPPDERHLHAAGRTRSTHYRHAACCAPLHLFRVAQRRSRARISP